MGKTEAGTFGFSIPTDDAALNGGEVGGKFGVGLPGDRVGVVDVPVVPTEGRFETDDAGDEVVLFGGSNELAWRRIGGVDVHWPLDGPLIIEWEDRVAWEFEPSPMPIFVVRTLGATRLFSRSCCICLWRFSCKSNKEILWIKEGLFTTVAGGAASPSPPAWPKLDNDDDVMLPILEDPKLTTPGEGPLRELSFRSRDVREDAALGGRAAAAAAAVVVSEEEERADVRPWL